MSTRRTLFITGALVGLLGLGAGLAALRGAPIPSRVAPSGAGEGGISPGAMAKRFHRAEGRCLRFDAGTATDEEVARAADALTNAGIASRQLGELAGAFLRWELDREAAVHVLPEDEEWYEGAMEDSQPIEQLILWAQWGQLRKSIVIDHTARLADGARALAALPEEQRQQLRSIWEAHARTLNISNLLEVVTSMRRTETEARLSALASALEDRVREGAALPEQLDELEGLAPDALKDGWANAFHYDTTVPGRVRVSSLGQDGAPGGKGAAADSSREVMLKPAAQPEVVQRASSAECAPLPARATVTRAEYTRVWEDPEVLVRSAIIAPVVKSETEMEGFLLRLVMPGSPLARAGFCSGDVVLEVDGTTLASPANLVELTGRLQRARTVPFSVRRKGTVGTLTLQIQ
ncbi:PDZ domain-containing protein [Myxococcaceae bacterium GXIMD 01537]